MTARGYSNPRGAAAGGPLKAGGGALFALALGVFALAAPAPAAGDEPVVIGIAGRGGAPGPIELALEPDPIVLVRSRPEPPTWRLDPTARGAAHTFAVSFEEGSPFVTAAGTSSAELSLSLGPLRPPIELGSYSYVARLFEETGVILAETRGSVRIEESTGLARRAGLVLAALGVVFLLFNYLDTKSYTRTYEH
jgi:hypothetical protein